MRALLTTGCKLLAILVIVASVFGPGMPLPTFVAHAENDPNSPLAPGQKIPAANASSYNIPSGSTSDGTTITAPSTITPATQNTQTNTNSGGSGTDDIGCTNWGNQGASKGMAICVSSLVYYIMVGIGSTFAGVAAYVFNYALQLSLTSGAYAMDFVYIGWGIIRDVANMAFLFILVYIAFKVILQAETAGTMRMLVWVVIIALFVNFSFFMTRIVIDFGNIFALQFYSAITQNAPNLPAANGAVATKDVTATIMNALNPQSLTSSNVFKAFYSNDKNSAMYILIVLSLIYFMMGIAFFLLAAIFIYAAVKFVLRVVGLWGLIIVAPAAFVARIFSGQAWGQWYDRWLEYLIKFALYPAVFLLFFYMQSRFMIELSNNGGGSLFASAFVVGNAGQNDINTIIQAVAAIAVRLAFIIVTMYVTLSVADIIVQEGGSAAAWVQSKALAGMQGRPLAAAGMWALQGKGFIARNLREKWAPNIAPKVGRGLTYMDLQNLPGLGGTLRTITTATGKLNKNLKLMPADYGRAYDIVLPDKKKPEEPKKPWKKPTVTDITPEAQKQITYDGAKTEAEVTQATRQSRAVVPRKPDEPIDTEGYEVKRIAPKAAPSIVPQITDQSAGRASGSSAPQITHSTQSAMGNKDWDKLMQSLGNRVEREHATTLAPVGNVPSGHGQTPLSTNITNTNIHNDSHTTGARHTSSQGHLDEDSLAKIKKTVKSSINHAMEDQAAHTSTQRSAPTTQEPDFNSANMYKRLGLSEMATKDDILAASKALMKQYHPDNGGDLAKAQAVGEALALLRDEAKRSSHRLDILKGKIK